MVKERLTVAEIQGKLIGKSATEVLGYYDELLGTIILEAGIPLDLLGMYVDSAGVIRKKSSPADIEVSRKVKSLGAGANADTHDFSSHAVELYWVSVENPDGATRVIVATLRNAADDIVSNLGDVGVAATAYARAKFTTGPTDFMFLQFPGGLQIPYNYDISIAWAAMTGGNNSIHSVGYRWLNDQ